MPVKISKTTQCKAAVQDRHAGAVSAADEPPRRFDRAILVEVVMPATGKAHELPGLAGKREQTLAEPDRDRGIVSAMHDQQRPETRAMRRSE